MNDAAKRVLPNTAQTDLDGQSREFKKSGGEIYFTFVLALLSSISCCRRSSRASSTLS
jgi:multidrug efflux pump